MKTWEVVAGFFIMLGFLLVACYAHTPVPPGQPNPADYPPLTDRLADGGR